MAFVLPPHHHEFQHVHKRFPTRYHDGHASLARETRRDPVGVDRSCQHGLDELGSCQGGARQRRSFSSLYVLPPVTSLNWTPPRHLRRNESQRHCLQCLQQEIPAIPCWACQMRKTPWSRPWSMRWNLPWMNWITSPRWAWLLKKGLLDLTTLAFLV